MANYEPTIVAASLNDSDLKASIDELVKYVKEKSTEMADAFDGQVERMKRKLGELGNVSINLGSDTKDGGTSQRTKKLKEEESQVKATQQAHKELKMTADQETEVIKNITSANSKKTIEEQANSKVLNDEVATLGQLREQYEAVAAQANRRFDVSTIQQLRMQQHELEAGMRVASREAERSKKDVEDMTSAIENYRRTMQYLPKTPQGIENARDIQKQINEMTVLRDAAKDEQQKWVESGRKLSGQYENVKAQIRQIGQGLVDADRAEQERVQGAKQYSAEIRKQAQEIRANESFKKQGFFDFSDATGHWMRVFANEKKFGAVEQQLVDLERIKANYSKEVYNYEEKSTKERKSWVNAQDRINTAEERYLASLASEEEKQRSAKKHLLEAKTIYDDINRNQERSKSMSVQWQYETTIDSLARIRDAYNNLTSEDKKSEFGKNMSARIKDLEKDLGSLAEKMKDESLMAYDLGNSYLQLSRKLTRLQSIYQSLNEEERNSSRGKGIAEKIQETSRNISQIQKQMTRPTSLESVLGFEPKTLDDIAYKMRQLQAYKQGIDLTNDGEANEIKKVDDALKGLQKQMDKYMGKSRQVGEINNALSRSWNYMKNRLAFYFTVGATTSFVKQLAEIRSQYELTERALGILVNSAEHGSKAFKELSEMALVSPYTLIELSSAAKQLVAYDVAAKDVVDTTRRLADMASAVGVPMERLTYALGQIKAYGYLNSRDARMFLNTGIPLVKALSERYTELEGRLVSIGDVYDRIKDKAVSYNDVMAVVNEMTDEGGRFFNFQAKMADTLKVQIANLTLAWNNMLNYIGKAYQGTASLGIGVAKELFLQWKNIDSMIWNVIYTYGAFKTTQLLALTFSKKFHQSLTGTAKQVAKVTNVMNGLKKSLISLFSNPWTWVFIGISAAISFVQHWSNAKEAIEDFNKSIADAAKESSDSIGKILKSEEMLSVRNAAKEGKLSQKDAVKTWETMRSEIELSSAASDIFISKLMLQEDLNKRITESFDVAEKIQEANDKLSLLGENAIKFSQDSWLNGLFGEGLEEDLEDYIEMFKKSTNGGWLGKIYATDLYRYEDEANKEMKGFVDDLVETLENRLGASLYDKDVLTEAIERIRVKVKDANPKIRGEVENYFDVKLDELLGERFGELYDTQTSLRKQFLTILKSDYRSAFSVVTDDILKKDAEWSDDQMKAIHKAADELKKTTIPAFHSAIDEMVSYMNSQDWRVTITATMGTAVRSAFQKEFDERAGMVYLRYRPKEGQELEDWSDENVKQLDKLREDLKKYDGENTEYANRRKQEISDEIKDREYLGKLFHQPLTKDKGSKGKDVLGDALSKEVQLIRDIQKRYQEYRKMGVQSNEAVEKSTSEYGKTLDQVGKTLASFGIQTKNNDELAKMSTREVKGYFNQLLASAERLKNVKGIEAIEKAIADLNVEITKFDIKKVTDGLNNELSKIKDEYELAVELDATPEMSGVFRELMGLSEEDLQELPRTYNQVIAKLQAAIDRELGDRAKFDLANNLDIESFTKWIKENGFQIDDGIYKMLDKYREYVVKMRVDEAKETTRVWNELVEKYGQLQQKLLKITKDGVKEQVDVIKQFGASDEIKDAINLSDKIAVSDDPETISRLTLQLQEIINKVAEENPKALNIITAIQKSTSKKGSNAQWENFKDRDLYTMTFENMDNLSVRAIRHIISELEALKDKVKEDPASMKALIGALEDAEKQIIKRRPFESIITSLKDWRNANKEVVDAQKKLKIASEDLNNARVRLESAEDEGERAIAENKVSEATDKHKQAVISLTNAENKQAKAQTEFQDSLSASASALNNVGSLMQQFVQLLGLAEDSEAADAVNAVVQGFQAMSTALGIVASAALLAQMSLGWVAGVALALGGLIGLLTFFINRKDKQILKQIKASERTVKELEMAYKQLQETVEDAYGMIEVGAKRAAVENKKLQLEELKRQLQLQESRRKKKQDEDEIRDLRGQIQDLTNEIKNDIQEITDSMLGISSVGDAAETLVSSMIDAFRQGEDYMKVYEDTFEDMVDNMIMKAIVGRVIGDEIDKMLRQVEEAAEFRAVEDPEVQYWKNAVEHWKKRIKESEEEEKSSEYIKGLQEFLQDAEQNLSDAYAKALTPTIEDIKTIGNMKDEFREGVQSKFEAWMDAFGISYGDRADKNLSNLQQGIQGITEDTASALEGYMNIVSQRIFEHGTILTDIRDTLKGFDFDLGLGVQSQMLLQLQSSYQVQISIQNILNGVLNPSGRAFVVELNS